MRTRIALWSVGPLAILAAVVLIGSQLPQSEAQDYKPSPARANQHQVSAERTHQGEMPCKASDVIGMEVRGFSGEDKIGSIHDLVLGQDGRVRYAAVAFGGFLGIGDKLFAVPFEALDLVKTDRDAYARIDVTEETLKQKQGFNRDKWPSEADRSFSNGQMRQQAATSNTSR